MSLYHFLKKSALIGTAGIYLCFTPFIGWGAEPYPIERAVIEGLSTSPDLSGVFNDQLAAEQRILQQRSRYNPSLNLTATSGYSNTDTPLIPDQELFQNQVSLTFSQLLFDGFETSSLIGNSKNQFEASRFRTLEATNLVAVNIINSYLNVLRNRKLLKNATENLTVHEEFYGRIKDGADAGRFNLGELGQIEARLALAKSTFESAKLNLEQSIADYAQNIGLEPEGTFFVPDFQSDLLDGSPNDFVTYAKTSSPTIASFASELEAANDNITAAKSDFYPDVNLEVTGSAGNDLGGIEGTEEIASALVVLRWNLFSGGLNTAEVKENKFLRAGARDSKISALRILERDIRNTWSAKEASQRQVKEFDRQIKANVELVRIYNEQFGIGRRTLLDVLDTQNSLFIARSNYINAILNTLLANYQLLALSGDLTAHFKINDPAAIIVDPEAEPVLNKNNDIDLRFDQDIAPNKTDYGIEKAKINAKKKHATQSAYRTPENIIRETLYKNPPAKLEKKFFQKRPTNLNLVPINHTYQYKDADYTIEIAEFTSRLNALYYLKNIRNSDVDVLKNLVIHLDTTHSNDGKVVILKTEKLTALQQNQICDALRKNNFMETCPSDKR